VIASLLQAALSSGDYPHAAVPYADVGDRFRVSRTHVRKLLVAAEEIGLVKLHARGSHRVEILPRLWSTHDRGISGGMYLHDMIYLAATRAYAADFGARPAAAASLGCSRMTVGRGTRIPGPPDVYFRAC
jgi:hypothetical protein